jgi:hypothetical protein
MQLWGDRSGEVEPCIPEKLPEDWGSKFLRNAGELLPNYKALHSPGQSILFTYKTYQ